MEAIQHREKLVPLEFKAYTILKDGTQDLSHFNIETNKPISSGVVVNYKGLDGNLPETYKNSIALWSGLLPNKQRKPIKRVNIKNDDQAGDVWIEYGFQQSYYSLTYQVGASLRTMCALAQLDLTSNTLTPVQGVRVNKNRASVNMPEFIDMDKGTGAELKDVEIPTYVELKIKELTATSIKVFYSTLPGYLPAKYKNWIGVWQGYASPYNAPDPMGSENILQDFTQGTVLLGNVSFSKYLTYTLIYFTGADRANAASLMYFDTGGEVRH
ncbi:MAG: hypothetical protein KAT34_11140 [Candidatus Aminicenantes bacterium]|nr:hypothetical protein [Candidatus Aminicenantes bacterium]